MNKLLSTQEKFLKAARELFWTRGYSNALVSDITKGVVVDKAGGRMLTEGDNDHRPVAQNAHAA